jgi:hypothetical protein
LSLAEKPEKFLKTATTIPNMFSANIINLLLKVLKNVATAGKIKTFEIINTIEKFKPPSKGRKPFLIMYIFTSNIMTLRKMVQTARI